MRLTSPMTQSVRIQARHRETDYRLQSKDDDDMTNLLSPGVKLIPKLGVKLEEPPRNHSEH